MVVVLKIWIWRFWGLFGFVSLIIGLSGVPGDIEQWSVWISAMIENPIVLKLAEQATYIANVVNQPISRLVLVFVGLVAIAWPLRWFWRLRHKIRIYGRSLVSENVWVSKEDAIEEIRRSDWAKLKEPHIVDRTPLLERLSLSAATSNFSTTVSGMSDAEKTRK